MDKDVEEFFAMAELNDHDMEAILEDWDTDSYALKQFFVTANTALDWWALRGGRLNLGTVPDHFYRSYPIENLDGKDSNGGINTVFAIPLLVNGTNTVLGLGGVSGQYGDEGCSVITSQWKIVKDPDSDTTGQLITDGYTSYDYITITSHILDAPLGNFPSVALETLVMQLLRKLTRATLEYGYVTFRKAVPHLDDWFASQIQKVRTEVESWND